MYKTETDNRKNNQIKIANIKIFNFSGHIFSNCKKITVNPRHTLLHWVYQATNVFSQKTNIQLSVQITIVFTSRLQYICLSVSRLQYHSIMKYNQKYCGNQ